MIIWSIAGSFFLFRYIYMSIFSGSRFRVTRSDIEGLRDNIEGLRRDINTTNNRINDRVRLRELREVNKDIRSLFDKIEKNKDFIPS